MNTIAVKNWEKKKNIMHTMSLYFSGKIYLKFGMNVE